jgi:hypothetical protein
VHRLARVTDSDVPPHPVLGASVTFQSIISRTAPDPPPVPLEEIIITRNPMPVIVSSSQATMLSDVNGLAMIQPSNGTVQGVIQILDTAVAGGSSLQFSAQSLWPIHTQGTTEKRISSDVDLDGAAIPLDLYIQALFRQLRGPLHNLSNQEGRASLRPVC